MHKGIVFTKNDILKAEKIGHQCIFYGYFLIIIYIVFENHDFYCYKYVIQFNDFFLPV